MFCITEVLNVHVLLYMGTLICVANFIDLDSEYT